MSKKDEVAVTIWENGPNGRRKRVFHQVVDDHPLRIMARIELAERMARVERGEELQENEVEEGIGSVGHRMHPDTKRIADAIKRAAEPVLIVGLESEEEARRRMRSLRRLRKHEVITFNAIKQEGQVLKVLVF